MHKVLKACVAAAAQHGKRVSTATLNVVLGDATAWKAPPSSRSKRRAPRLYYVTQPAIRPPTFVFFCNDAKLISDDYKRYLERSLRESIEFDGTPLRLLFRGKVKEDRSGRARARDSDRRTVKV